MLVMQALRVTRQKFSFPFLSCFEYSRQRGRGIREMRAYSMPKLNMKTKLSFLVRLICNFRSWGMGNSKMATSCAMPMAAMEKANALRLMHFEREMVKSHVALMGLHWKMMTRLEVMEKAAAKNIIRMASRRSL